MRLCSLSLKGFRSFKDISWSPKSLNIVIGPNGSGKSNLLKLLDMIRLCADGEFRDYILREGGMDQILWDNQAEKIEIHLNLCRDGDHEQIAPFDLEYSLQIRKKGYEGDFQIEQEFLRTIHDPSGHHESVMFLERNPSLSYFRNYIDADSISMEIESTETLLSQLKTPFTKDSIPSKLQKLISSWRIFQSIDTSPHSPIRKPTISRRDTTLFLDGSNLISVLHTLYTTNRDFERSIDLAMVAAFGEDYDKLVFPPAADKQIQLRIRWKTLKQERSASDISDGTLRYLFLLTILAHPEPGSLIAIDEPETGLHPAMMRIVAEYAKEMSQRTQVIITTHSSEFLTACGGFIPSTLIIEWKEGESVMRQVSEEKLKYWLEDYTLGSLFSSGELEGME